MILYFYIYIFCTFTFLWPCIVSEAWRKNTNKMQQHIWFIVSSRCWLLTTASTCFGHLYAHHQEKRPCVTAYGVYLLVVLDVAGCGSAVLRCRVWALWRLLPDWAATFTYTGLFISPSGISELDCATTKTDMAEKEHINRERISPRFFFTRGLGVLAGSTARG